jgi:hypothetical protein
MMKRTAALIGTLLSLASPPVARAASMFAGPLFPTGNDTCECEIVNVTTSPKSVQIQVISATGTVLTDTGVFTLGAGQAAAGVSPTSNQQQYCKFVNASPTSFRASMACFLSGPTSAGSDFVALPAR